MDNLPLITNADDLTSEAAEVASNGGGGTYEQFH